jgi:hypothetical protein
MDNQDYMAFSDNGPEAPTEQLPCDRFACAEIVDRRSQPVCPFSFPDHKFEHMSEIQA